jgi:prolyl-tRNA editing enzyme YbaK/EbsC (Cys-tRNA(Pro) deacylase)
MKLHPSSQAVNDILAAAGLPGRVRILPEPASNAPAAARQLGCPVGAIANSLVFATSVDEPVLIMTSGRHRVDLDLIREGYRLELHRASAEFVRAHTGQPIGGVAPVGHPRPLHTLVDRALADYEQLWAAGGIPHAVFPLSYPDLLLLTSGTEADVA